MRMVIDFLAAFAAIAVVQCAYGWWWGVAAGIAVAAYGVFCFADGIRTVTGNPAHPLMRGN